MTHKLSVQRLLVIITGVCCIANNVALVMGQLIFNRIWLQTNLYNVKTDIEKQIRLLDTVGSKVLTVSL